ncbi:nrm1-like protein [Grosmannia clavigera kw1407]|uniref:Nrm1-like protein n=1 Tax=Grosmannia clavigera (strain kw1407 / UAMH 11150) TaxID=655863 RepID=F0XR78_GROCL|nr:nrm1-like protein [Grosmannia clavigera kw1407]EFW99866.1 nrm1-like protein [Grosmannia clavigera kw1407]
MITATIMAPSAIYTSQPDVVADRVLRRAELGKMACRLQNRLALAQFKTRNGWEDLTLDMIEPKVEEEIRRKRGCDGDVLSDSSSSTSELPYPSHRGLMSSPLKPPFFSDAIGSSNGSTGHRKRTYVASFDDLHQNRHDAFVLSSPSKRYRSSPPLTAGSNGDTHYTQRSASAFLPQQPPFSSHSSWKDHHQLANSSPIKPRRQQHFTTAAGPDVSLFPGARRIADALAPTNYNAAQSDTDDELLPTHSYRASSASFGLSTTTAGGHAIRSGSPPSTPPMRNRTLPSNNRRRKRVGDAYDVNDGFQGPNGGGHDGDHGAKSGVEGADLLLYLAASPSPANPSGRNRMDPPSTPPSKFNNMALPSSMMTTPGGGSMFPNTPGQHFDFSDFVNITPSPAQKPWKTPNLIGSRTPMSVNRRRLTFDDPL